MFEDDNSSVEFGKLFDDAPEPEVNEETLEEPLVENENEETEEPEEVETESEDDEEESDIDGESEEPDTEEKEKEPESSTLATIEIDGKSFELDEQKIQTIAEKYVEVVKENKQYKEYKEQLDGAMAHIKNIQDGKDIDEAMLALGVDWNKLITDKVKEFIRRSTLSEKERQYEDAAAERDRLRKKIQEREERDELSRQEQEGKKQAELIIDNVNAAISKVPEQFRKEIQIEVFGAIEKRLRSGQNRPSAKAIANAVTTIYNRKYKALNTTASKSVTSKSTSVPKLTRNSPTPSTTQKRSPYNATDYNELF